MSTRQDNNTNGQPTLIQAHGSWAREPGTFVLEEVDSPTSIPDPFAILVESELIPISVEFEPHEHPLHELAFVRGGMMTVRLSEHVIIVPEGHGDPKIAATLDLSRHHRARGPRPMDSCRNRALGKNNRSRGTHRRPV